MELTKALTKERQDRIYKLYLTAFPESERKPFPLLIEKQEEGIVDILSIEEDGHFLGLAIMVRYLDMVLLDYLRSTVPKRKRPRILGCGSEGKSFITETD